MMQTIEDVMHEAVKSKGRFTPRLIISHPWLPSSGFEQHRLANSHEYTHVTHSCQVLARQVTSYPLSFRARCCDLAWGNPPLQTPRWGTQC
jgi:hypothetical protein